MFKMKPMAMTWIVIMLYKPHINLEVNVVDFGGPSHWPVKQKWKVVLVAVGYHGFDMRFRLICVICGKSLQYTDYFPIMVHTVNA